MFPSAIILRRFHNTLHTLQVGVYTFFLISHFELETVVILSVMRVLQFQELNNVTQHRQTVSQSLVHSLMLRAASKGHWVSVQLRVRQTLPPPPSPGKALSLGVKKLPAYDKEEGKTKTENVLICLCVASCRFKWQELRAAAEVGQNRYESRLNVGIQVPRLRYVGSSVSRAYTHARPRPDSLEAHNTSRRK